jgi:hypothetical protein
MSLLRAGIITDSHIPYEHKRRYAAMMNCFADARLDALYIIGDFADFYGINGHGPKNPGVLESFKEEVEAVNKRLDEIDQLLPDKKKGYVEGNHEYRFERYLLQNAPALFGVTECRNLFKIDQRPGWSWLSYGPHQLGRVLNSKLYIKHEPSITTITTMAKHHGANLTFGHIHRIVESYHRNIEGQQLVSFCSGWLGDARMDKIFGYIKGHNLWQNGFTMVDVDPSNGFFYHQTISFLENDSCVYHGKIYNP